MRAPDQLEAAPFVAAISLPARARAASRLALCLLFWLASPGLAWASLTGLSGLDASSPPTLPSKLETAALEQREPECVAFCAPVLRLELEAGSLAGRVPDSWHPFALDPRDERPAQALFATEWGTGIVNYANDNPTRFVDPDGHAAIYPEDVDSAEESVRRNDEIKRVIDAGGMPSASGHIGVTGGLLSQKYGAGARERVRALREGGFSKAAVMVVEESDFALGAPDMKGLYSQFLHSAGGLASEITGLEQAFAEQVGGAKAGDAIDLSELYSFANDYANSRIDQTLSSLPGNFITKPIRQTWTVLGLGEDAPVDRRMDAAVSAGLDVAGGAALGRVLYRAGAGFALGFKQGLSGAPNTGAAPSTASARIQTTVGNLRSAELRDAHHVIQDAAVRDLPGYQTELAPGTQLQGPSNVRGTAHYEATQVQRQAGGGTYAAERRIGYKALRKAGLTDAQARAEIARADQYFQSIGVTPQTQTRVPGNR